MFKKLNAKLSAAVALMVLAAPSAFAQAVENPIVTLINSISLAGVAAAVAAIMLIVVGIAMTFKGGTVAKRVVRSV